jgi:Uma2 family endonuclease
MTIAKDPSQPQLLLIDVSNTTLHSAEQLERLQSDNPDLHLELTEDGKLIVMSPNRSEWVEMATAAAALPQANSSVDDSISSSIYQLPELTPEETARRLAMVERRIERERQEWNNFTPEQKAEHDRQFEELYESLAESRR